MTVVEQFDADIDLLDSEKAAQEGRQYHSAQAPIGIRHQGTEFEEKRVGENYEQFYTRGGWSYDLDVERAFLVHRILRPLGITPGSKILELGCGTGKHAQLLHSLGMQVTAIDLSAAGIEQARKQPGVDFRCVDAAEFLRNCDTQFDMVFARGMAWFHYELEPGVPSRSGVDIDASMISLMKVVKPGGLFVLQICTNFTGELTSPVEKGGVRNHSWEQSVNFMNQYGQLAMITDWHGVPLPDSAAALKSGCGLIAATRKIVS